MLLDVEADDLFMGVNPKPEGCLDDMEEDHHGGAYPDGDRKDADQLGDKLSRAAAVDEAESVCRSEQLHVGIGVVVGKDADENRPHRSAEAMNPDRADRVVNFQLPVDQLNAVDDGKSRDDADEDGTGDRYRRASRRNGDQPPVNR